MISAALIFLQISVYDPSRFTIISEEEFRNLRGKGYLLKQIERQDQDLKSEVDARVKRSMTKELYDKCFQDNETCTGK